MKIFVLDTSGIITIQLLSDISAKLDVIPNVESFFLSVCSIWISGGGLAWASIYGGYVAIPFSITSSPFCFQLFFSLKFLFILTF